MQEMQELHDTSLSQGDTILFPDSLRTGSVPGAAMFFLPHYPRMNVVWPLDQKNILHHFY